MSEEQVEIGYRVTLTGRGLKKRCRKRSDIHTSLPGLLLNRDVPDSLYESAKAYLAANYKDVTGACIELMETKVQGMFSSFGFDSKFVRIDLETRAVIESRNLDMLTVDFVGTPVEVDAYVRDRR